MNPEKLANLRWRAKHGVVWTSKDKLTVLDELEAAKAEAWEQGARAGLDAENPYRKDPR